ncbi:MAG TPA: OmpW family outer membrane protein [Spongiibacteraceae bacterium]|nr:OmpW family outer membrane protein [Spongiibacteraceae bacterium]
MKSLNKNILALAAAAAVSGQVAAYEAGDWVVRAGYADVEPQESSTALKLDGTKLGGTSVGVDGAAALGITASYMLTSHIGVELLAATPFSHEIYTKGLGGLGLGLHDVRLGTTKHLPPTVSVQYYFLDSTSNLQPYAGVGINYTTFFNESVSSEAKNELGAKNMSLDDSYGFAGELGLDYRLDDHWLVNAAVWYIQIETDASVETALGKVKSTVTLDPWVYMLSVGYKF